MSADERAALVERIKAADHLIYSGKGVGAWEAINMHRDMLALIEADGKRLALADAAPHDVDVCNRIVIDQYGRPVLRGGVCTCWKAEYDATKEGERG